MASDTRDSPKHKEKKENKERKNSTTRSFSSLQKKYVRACVHVCVCVCVCMCVRARACVCHNERKCRMNGKHDKRVFVSLRHMAIGLPSTHGRDEKSGICIIFLSAMQVGK